MVYEASPGPYSVDMGMDGMVKKPRLQGLIYLRTIQPYMVCLEHYVLKQKLISTGLSDMNVWSNEEIK